MAQAYEDPGYAADESTEEGYVRLRVKMTGLKVKSAGIFDKLTNSHPLPVGKNAVIDEPVVTERSFRLTVRGNADGPMNGAAYQLDLRQLPYSIDTEKTYLTGEEGWINVFLKKVNVHQSWEKYIRDGNLDVTGKEEPQ